MKNEGKKFEEDFQKSVPLYCLLMRLRDSAQSFSMDSSKLRFSLKNPCDFILFDSVERIFFTLELKSTKGKCFSFENIKLGKEQPKKDIHVHQILGLENFSKYKNVVSGFIFNFRDEKNKNQKTYFQSIDNFMRMIAEINKKSFNINDLQNYNPIEINGSKKISRYTWHLDNFFNRMRGN